MSFHLFGKLFWSGSQVSWGCQKSPSLSTAPPTHFFLTRSRGSLSHPLPPRSPMKGELEMMPRLVILPGRIFPLCSSVVPNKTFSSSKNAGGPLCGWAPPVSKKINKFKEPPGVQVWVSLLGDTQVLSREEQELPSGGQRFSRDLTFSWLSYLLSPTVISQPSSQQYLLSCCPRTSKTLSTPFSLPACWCLSFLSDTHRGEDLIGLSGHDTKSWISIGQYPTEDHPTHHLVAYDRLSLAEPQTLFQSRSQRAGTYSSTLGNQCKMTCLQPLWLDQGLGDGGVRGVHLGSWMFFVAPDLETKVSWSWAEHERLATKSAAWGRHPHMWMFLCGWVGVCVSHPKSNAKIH